MACVMMRVEGRIDADDVHAIKIMCRNNNCAPYRDFDDYFFFARVSVQYYIAIAHCFSLVRFQNSERINFGVY